MKATILVACVALLFAGCGAFSREDVPATLQAQNAVYATELAALPTSASLRATEVAVTLDVARAQLSAIQSVNAQLLSTVAAGASATPARVVAVESGDGAQGVMMDAAVGIQPSPSAPILADASGMTIIQIATANSVRESDGCAESVQTVFSTTVDRIYVTGVAQNLRAGVQIEGNWFNGGTLAATTDWIPTQDYAQLCIWFFISPTETPGLVLQAGQWSVSLSVNGQLVGEPVAFTVQ